MNRQCCGDFFTVDGRRLYRCLLDSTIIADTHGLNGVLCIHCGRQISAEDHGERTTYTQTRRFAKLPDCDVELPEHASSTPLVDTSTAGENWWIDDSVLVLHADNYACGFTGVELAKFDRIKERHNASLVALREQLEPIQETFGRIRKTAVDACGFDDEGAPVEVMVRRAFAFLQRKLATAEAALKQKDEALKQALNDERRRLQNPHSDDEPVADEHLLKYQPYRLYHDVLAIQPNSTALKTVIEAETVKLREALELAQKLVGDLCYGSLELYEAQRIARRIDEPIQQVLAASAQKAGTTSTA